MVPNEFLNFDINDFAESDGNRYCEDNHGFGGVNWEGAGPSQSYLGGGVQGDLSPYPDFPSPSTAPTSLYPTRGVFTYEGKLCCISQYASFGLTSLIAGYNSPFYQGAAMPSCSPQQAAATLPFLAPSPVPTLSRGCKSLPVTCQALITHLQ